MKIGLVILGVMMPMLMFSQYGKNYTDNKHESRWNFVSFSVDPAQAIYGSKKNDPGLNFIVKIGARENRQQLNIFYEQFSVINYRSYGFQPSYMIVKRNNFHVFAGSELSMIRRRNWTTVAYAFSAKIEYHLRDIFFSLTGDLKRRTDVRQKWGYSNYIEIGFKF